MPSRALVVDDDTSICGMIHGVLIGAGIEALVLNRSEGVEEQLRREKFAVAMFDLCMPAPDGLELARHARKIGINQMTPIILMSDDQSTSATSQGFEAGASFFLYKPIDKKRLVALVRAMQGAIEQERRRFRRVQKSVAGLNTFVGNVAATGGGLRTGFVRPAWLGSKMTKPGIGEPLVSLKSSNG